jgi:hypothetical protein
MISFWNPLNLDCIYGRSFFNLLRRFLQDEFSGVITKALSTLVLGLETRLENELANMGHS